MKARPTLALIAGDPGGGAALAPVVEALQAQQWPHRLYAYNESLLAWRARGWQVSPADQPDLRDVAGVVCATSVNTAMYELRWIAAARLASTPSLSLIDFWSNYAPRFVLDGQTVLPDRIAVMDTLARDEMVMAGFAAAMLVSTGQPALDGLAGRARPSAERRAAIRQACGLHDARALAVFVSQPLRVMAHLLKQPVLIDERQALSDIEAAVLALSQSLAGQHIALRIKLHPREKRDDFDHIGNIWSDTQLAPAELAHDLLMCADIVLGIHSMMLFEACHLGCRVVSYQPGLDVASDPLPSNRAGWSWRCTQATALADTLAHALTGRCAQPPALDGKAAQRVIDAISQLIMN
ncbi:hypothetical protein [Chitinimonas taiwanensis]|uniref:hypothetical protein n=1 Tax=Chitinimonas taiwanensis TaxID=240412 RepID=UPI0035AE19C0